MREELPVAPPTTADEYRCAARVSGLSSIGSSFECRIANEGTHSNDPSMVPLTNLECRDESS